ncbi:uncharacterized protein DDB_G0282077-like [Procambarus clarkii]|uniref:uncharacterized protein DDB_G0282077-like n=1 Tax=Procambarus clarkii TaxID=6728 RepID=UPI0037427CAB
MKYEVSICFFVCVAEDPDSARAGVWQDPGAPRARNSQSHNTQSPVLENDCYVLITPQGGGGGGGIEDSGSGSAGVGDSDGGAGVSGSDSGAGGSGSGSADVNGLDGGCNGVSGSGGVGDGGYSGRPTGTVEGDHS